MLDKLVTHLLSKASFTTLFAQRLRPHNVPQEEAFPRVVYELLDESEPHTLQEAAGCPTARVQLRCQGRGASDFANCQSGVYLLRDLLNGYNSPTHGLLGGVGGVWVYCIRTDNLQDQPEEPRPGDERQILETSIDAVITYVRALPTLP